VIAHPRDKHHTNSVNIFLSKKKEALQYDDRKSGSRPGFIFEDASIAQSDNYSKNAPNHVAFPMLQSQMPPNKTANYINPPKKQS
jgi:hypothetical protein